jgi:hypothetical protein
MPTEINIIVCHRAKIIAVGLTKCGSTTLLDVFLRMSGFEAVSGEERRVAEQARASGALAAQGLEFYQCEWRKISSIVEANPDYRVFSVIRDPYKRIYSAYFDKLNRYTKKHRLLMYLYGKLARLASGAEKRKRVETANVAVHKFISFEMFLDALLRHGVDMDSHFELQSRMLDLNRVSYDRLLNLSSLSEDLPKLLEEFDVPTDMLQRLDTVPKSNKRRSKSNTDWLTDVVQKKIERLYQDDFEMLDLPLKT